MNALFVAAGELRQFLRKKRWRYCIIGGLAVIRWGEPRATQDVDISLLTGFGNEEKFVDALLRQFSGRIPDAREFTLANRVLLCKASNGVPLDISLAGFPYEERVIARASRFSFAPRLSLVTAAAEDVIVLKAFADRDQDWVDVRGIVAKHGNRLEWKLIYQELKSLCELKEDMSAVKHLRGLQRRAEQERP